MNNTIFKEFSPLQKLLLFIGVTFLSSLVFSFVGIKLVYAFFGIPTNELSEPNLLNNNHIRAYKLLIFFSHLGTFIIPSFLFVYALRDSFVNFFVQKRLSLQTLLILPILLIGVTLLSEWGLFLNQQIDFEVISSTLANNIKVGKAERDLMLAAFIGGTWESFFINVLLIAIIPAIGEELTFRGVLQPLFIKLSDKKHVSIIFVAFVFAFIHFQFLDFLPRFILGVVYGYVFYYSKNILTTILLHFFNNFLALLLVFYTVRTNEELIIESNGNVFVLILGVSFTIWGIYILKKGF